MIVFLAAWHYSSRPHYSSAPCVYAPNRCLLVGHSHDVTLSPLTVTEIMLWQPTAALATSWCRIYAVDPTTVLQSKINILPSGCVHFPLPCKCYMTSICPSSWFNHQNNIAEERRVCSSSLCSLFTLPCYLIPSMSIYPIFQLSQPVFLLFCKSASFAPIYDNGQNFICVF